MTRHNNAVNHNEPRVSPLAMVGVCLLVAGLILTPLQVHAQTTSQTLQPSVEVNLDVLDALGPLPATSGIDLYGSTPSVTQPNLYGSSSQIPGAVSEDSVLLLPIPKGVNADTGSVLLLDAPATTGDSDFQMPEPEVAAATQTTAEPETDVFDPDAALDPVAIVVPEPQPEPEVMAETEVSIEPEVIAVPEPEPEVIVTTTETEVAAASLATDDSSDDAFNEIEELLSEPVDPETIDVPEPAMTMDGTDIAVVSAVDAAMTSDDMRILFDGDSDELSDADRTLLLALAGQLDAEPDQRVQLRAYASSEDASPSDARRLALSRALAVRAFLIENDLRSTRIDVRALGDKAEDGPLDRIDIVLIER
ncbi:MAG: OmpA family protein [Rhodospirillaceae bacterium]|nr:OmpA family protein [Rhodospirillaceae bacterium]